MYGVHLNYEIISTGCLDTPCEKTGTSSIPEQIMYYILVAWPRGLRHELSSFARTLGSWFRIPLDAWMSVCVYSVFVLGSGLAAG
jgi:hypothetical protein